MRTAVEQFGAGPVRPARISQDEKVGGWQEAGREQENSCGQTEKGGRQENRDQEVGTQEIREPKICTTNQAGDGRHEEIHQEVRQEEIRQDERGAKVRQEETSVQAKMRIAPLLCLRIPLPTRFRGQVWDLVGKQL